MSLYHYSKVAEHCGTLGKRLAKHSLYYDTGSFKIARVKLQQAFPNVVSMRDAIGHSAEIMAQERNKHVITTEVEKAGLISKKGSGQLFIMNSLNDDEFINTYMGKIIGYRINQNSLDALVECCRGLFASFEPPGSARGSGTRP